jgi:hypothetical protein
VIDFVQDIHTELIFNMDEIGWEEWADRKLKKVFIPTVRPEKTVHHAVKRGGRRGTAIVTISMAGNGLTQVVVIDRALLIARYGRKDGAMVRTLF